MPRCFFGLVISGFLIWHGVTACSTQEISFPGRIPMIEFHGQAAVFFGLATIGFGLVVHLYSFECFYDAHPQWRLCLKVTGFGLLVVGLLLGIISFVRHLSDHPPHRAGAESQRSVSEVRPHRAAMFLLSGRRGTGLHLAIP